MNTEQYFLSLTEELLSLKDRVRLYIEDAHWLSDGEWKESVVRSILRRHLPSTVGVGRGFIVSDSTKSTQVDILLYDKTKPILFQDGEFILVTPDVVRGVIEVKTKIRSAAEMVKVLKKLATIAAFVQKSVSRSTIFFGLFSYEDNESLTTKSILNCLKSVYQENGSGTIHCISLGKSRFIRFCDFQVHNPLTTTHKWFAYQLDKKAPAYFIHNVVDHLNPEWASTNNSIWYPKSGKDPFKIDEISIEIHR